MSPHADAPKERASASRRPRGPASPARRLACVLAAVSTLAAGCNDSFEPIAPSRGAQLSVFGYLDASADTQWIRVTPLRPIKMTSPDSLGLAVRLTELGTGRTIALRDSLFRFSREDDATFSSTSAYVHNFWTVEKILPGARYRFSVRLESGDTAEAVVDIPRYYPVEVSVAQIRAPDYIRIPGPRHLPFLVKTARFYDRCGWGADSVRLEPDSADVRLFGAEFNEGEVDERANCGYVTVTRRGFWMAASEASWPVSDASALAGLGIPEQHSNITNAVGFLGGVLSRSVPYEQCTFQASPGTPVPSYCVLRYDEATATLKGRVREVRCGDGPLDSVTVTVTELDRDPAKVRTIFTDPTGAYEISGLDPGVRYMVKDSALPEIDPFAGEISIHDIPVDTVEFSPGEQRETDVELQRLTYCPVKPARG